VRQALPEDENLATLLGGRRGALDATLPGVGYVIGWALAERFAPGPSSIAVGCAAAFAVGLALSIFRLTRGAAPRAVVLGLLGVAVAAAIALRTGRAVDFFFIQVASNAVSALAWTASILVRWPFLGLIVGLVLRQRTRWRRDPDLLRAYMRASWPWVGQYLVRLAVFVPLFLTEQAFALGVARVVLTWPLVAACLAASWWVLRRSLPPDHPGLRHPSS
jgi:hypothetical protein